MNMRPTVCGPQWEVTVQPALLLWISEVCKLLHGFLRNLAGVIDEHMPGPDLGRRKALTDILTVNRQDIAAVFFVYAELPVAHLQRRLEAQEVCAQRGDTGAAPALPHKFQGVEHKAGIHLADQAAQMPGNLGGGHAAVTAFTALNGQQPQTGAERAAVDHVDAFQL